MWQPRFPLARVFSAMMVVALAPGVATAAPKVCGDQAALGGFDVARCPTLTDEGGGVYSVIGDFTLTDDLLLTLTIAGAPPQTWHGTADGSPYDFPLIDKTLTLHDYLCYDQVFTLVGRPVSDAPRPPAEQSPLQAPHAARP